MSKNTAEFKILSHTLTLKDTFAFFALLISITLLISVFGAHPAYAKQQLKHEAKHSEQNLKTHKAKHR